jgi:hypothetical protein
MKLEKRGGFKNSFFFLIPVQIAQDKQEKLLILNKLRTERLNEKKNVVRLSMWRLFIGSEVPEDSYAPRICPGMTERELKSQGGLVFSLSLCLCSSELCIMVHTQTQ